MRGSSHRSDQAGVAHACAVEIELLQLRDPANVGRSRVADQGATQAEDFEILAGSPPASRPASSIGDPTMSSDREPSDGGSVPGS